MWEIRREIRLKDRIYIGNKKGIYGLRAGNPRVGFSPTPSPVPMISQKKSVQGKCPFWWLVCCVCSGLQLVALRPCVKPESQEGSSLKTLIKDPYILLAAGQYDLMFLPMFCWRRDSISVVSPLLSCWRRVITIWWFSLIVLLEAGLYDLMFLPCYPVCGGSLRSDVLPELFCWRLVSLIWCFSLIILLVSPDVILCGWLCLKHQLTN